MRKVKVNPLLSAQKLAIIAENDLGKKLVHQQLGMCSIRKISMEEKPDNSLS